jgi:hypothetical protein
VPATGFNRCTHVLVKKSNSHVKAITGLYTYSPGGIMILDEDNSVKLIAKQSDLAFAQKKGYLNLLTHKETWEEIEKEMKDKVSTD